MNKLVEKRETERQVASTPPPITPAVYQAELERFRQAAIRNTKPSLMGQVLRFRKGEWLFVRRSKRSKPALVSSRS